jgi:hypothetical protein
MRARIIRAYKPWRPRGVFLIKSNQITSNQIKSNQNVICSIMRGGRTILKNGLKNGVGYER